MRLLAAVAVAALGAGCLLAADETAGLAPDDQRGLDACRIDLDCTLAGPSCCDCPSFAVAGASGWDDACEQVACPEPTAEPTACPALVARCDRGTCVAACAPSPCELACPDGFAVDAAGCTTCACASGPVAPECQADAECVRAPGDCCGCDRGGVDVAVPATGLAGFVAGLGCTGGEVCPGVSTCQPGAEPRCSGGRCVLGGGAAPPADGTCGRPDLPACPDGQVCVINADGAEAGTGRCEAP